MNRLGQNSWVDAQPFRRCAWHAGDMRRSTRTDHARMLDVPVVLAGALALALTACTAPAAVNEPSPTIDGVAIERAQLAQARVDALLDSYAGYLRSRWPGIELPATRIEAWLEPGSWPAAFEICASVASGLSVRTDPAEGILADPPPQTDAQLLGFETSIYLCQAALPPPTLSRNDPGPVEIAWVAHYVTIELPGCLRRHGAATVPIGGASPRPGSNPDAGSGSSSEGSDPYAVARGDEAELRRLLSLCPPAETVLGALTPAGDRR